MAESLKTVLMSALTSKATPAESDTLIVGEGNVLKKISFSQLFTYLKDKLGINTLNTNLGKTPRYVIYSVTCDGSGNIYLNGAAPGKKIIGVFPLNNELQIQSVGFSGNAYYAFCTDFSGGSCANRPVTIGVLYVD
nr:MAG TPA: hypothetical protein [Caudoviricetes sp.]